MPELKRDLERASIKTGIKIKVEGISYSEYSSEESHDDYEHPIRGMLRSGQIIYDVNGNLQELQNKYKRSSTIDNLGRRGVVKMNPPIQYKKQYKS